MRISILILVVCIATLWGVQSYSSEDSSEHKHSENEEVHSDQSDDHVHSEEEGHENNEEHAHEEDEDGHGHEEEEGGSAIGPGKGIIEKAEAGFKLSPEAFKTFEIQTKVFSGGKIVIPRDALVTIKGDKSVFRLRSDWYKRVKVEVVQKNENTVEIQSSNFREGDQIILSGSGFLRIAEVFSEEGASHSHSH